MMKNKLILSALLAAVLLSQTACEEVIDLGNRDGDYNVTTFTTVYPNYGTYVGIEVRSKLENIYGDYTETAFKDYYGKYKPLVTLGKAKIQDLADILWKGKSTSFFNGSYLESSTFGDFAIGGGNGYAKYYRWLTQVVTPAASDDGRIQLQFYHSKQEKERKFMFAVYYFDLTQNPPKQVTAYEYEKLQWVKDLKAQGK